MIDKIDEKIIKLLAKNGRIKLTDIAKHVKFIYITVPGTFKKIRKSKIYFRLSRKSKL